MWPALLGMLVPVMGIEHVNASGSSIPIFDDVADDNPPLQLRGADATSDGVLDAGVQNIGNKLELEVSEPRDWRIGRAPYTR